MRRIVALVLAATPLVLAVITRLCNLDTWFWSMFWISSVWLFTGIWFGRVNLRRTHGQMVKDEVHGKDQLNPLANWLLNGSVVFGILAVVCHFTIDT